MGQFEYEMLCAIQRLRSNAYGVTIQLNLAEQTKRKVSVGALYTTLGRMEEKGYLSSRTGAPTPERGGRSKKFYKLTAAGIKAQQEHEDRLQASLAHLQPQGV